MAATNKSLVLFLLSVRLYVLNCSLFSIVVCCPLAWADAIPVELRKSDSGWQLFRNDEPYFIQGAGGDASLEQLVAAGANSFRTWGSDDLDARLDQAHALGLSVTVGIWLGHERHGFDYSDKEQVAAQRERARRAVLRYKNHPAVLLWGVGNEMEGFAEGDDPAVWKAVNDIAVMIKQLDPNHPVMTVTAEIGGERIASINKYCPAIDIHGINTYGGAQSIPERYRARSAEKPYILTEFGPPGSWEIAKTEWGAPYELTSTAKAEFYRLSYERGVLGAPGLALGSYAFLWGHKMEATSTWFGMFLADGARLGAVDVMTQLWSGRPPDNLAPTVQPLVVEGPAAVEPGTLLRVSSEVADPEDGPIRVRWVLRRESGDYMTGGDYRPVPPAVEGAVIEQDRKGARVRMPKAPGAYRLFLYAYDDAGNAATANVPLRVKGEARTPMPFTVYDDRFEGMPWSPSGWMGNFDKLSVDDRHAGNPYHGEACIELRYEGRHGWVGVAWQHPANNWGEQQGGIDVRGAKALELWARGKWGGERIKIGVGLLGKEKIYPDSGMAAVDGIVLKDTWKRYRVPLDDVDLSSIKTGFYIAITGQSSPVTVYLDRIRYVAD